MSVDDGPGVFRVSGNLMCSGGDDSGGDDSTFVTPTDDDTPGPSRCGVHISAIRAAMGSKRGAKRVTPASGRLAMGAGMGDRRWARARAAGPGAGVSAGGAKRQRGVPIAGDHVLNAALYTQRDPPAAGGRPVMHTFTGRGAGVVMDPITALDEANAAATGGVAAPGVARDSDLPQAADEVAALSLERIVAIVMGYSQLPNRELMRGTEKNRLFTAIESVAEFVPGTMLAASSKHHGAGWVRKALAAGHRTTALPPLVGVEPAWESVQDMYPARPPARAATDALADDPVDGLAAHVTGRHTDAAKEGVAGAERGRQDALKMLELQRDAVEQATEDLRAELTLFKQARDAWADAVRAVDPDAVIDPDGEDLGESDDEVNVDEAVAKARKKALRVAHRVRVREDAKQRQEELLAGQQREVARETAAVRAAAHRATNPRGQNARMTRDQAAERMQVLGRSVPHAGAAAAAAATAKTTWQGSCWLHLQSQLVGAIAGAYAQIKAAARNGFVRRKTGGAFRVPSEVVAMTHPDLVDAFFDVVKAVGIRDRGRAGRMNRFDKDADRNKREVATATSDFMEAWDAVDRR